jgi:uncharacterized protein YicC (UPF0701 family)
MTGFAAVSREDATDKVNLTVKSVNHRFLDTQIKMPSSLASLESRIKAVLQQRLARDALRCRCSSSAPRRRRRMW